MAYNLTRLSNDLLDKYMDSPPSLSVQLYPEHWTLNSGSKQLYNQPAAALFDDIRAYRIPVDLLDLLDTAKVPFYDGCMIVELQDHRVQKVKDKRNNDEAKPLEVTRIVLRPNSESLWADLCLLNQKTGSKWTDRDALELEAKILVATAPPLCLDPDAHLGRVANSMVRVSTPRTPVPLRPRKRKAAALDTTEIDEKAQARRAKIMQFMDPKRNRPNMPSYRLFDHIMQAKAARAQPAVADSTSSSAATGPPALQQLIQAPPIPPPAQPPRTTATPVAPPTPVITEAKKLRPTRKDGVQTPINSTRTPTPVATPLTQPPVPLPAPQQPHPRQIPQPSPRPTSQSPHPAAAAYTATPPRIVPSPAQHAQASTASPRPPQRVQPSPQQSRPQSRPQLQPQPHSQPHPQPHPQLQSQSQSQPQPQPQSQPQPQPQPPQTPHQTHTQLQPQLQPQIQPQLQAQIAQRAAYAQQAAQAYPANMSQQNFVPVRGKPAPKANPTSQVNQAQLAMYQQYMRQQQGFAQAQQQQQQQGQQNAGQARASPMPNGQQRNLNVSMPPNFAAHQYAYALAQQQQQQGQQGQQDQPQMVQHLQPMFNYQQMNQLRGVPYQMWPVNYPRGVPIAGGQQQGQGAHPAGAQQVPVSMAAKAAQGGSGQR